MCVIYVEKNSGINTIHTLKGENQVTMEGDPEVCVSSSLEFFLVHDDTNIQQLL